VIGKILVNALFAFRFIFGKTPSLHDFANLVAQPYVMRTMRSPTTKKENGEGPRLRPVLCEVKWDREETAFLMLS
jgi:hypothetical protein